MCFLDSYLPKETKLKKWTMGSNGMCGQRQMWKGIEKEVLFIEPQYGEQKQLLSLLWDETFQ